MKKIINRILFVLALNFAITGCELEVDTENNLFNGILETPLVTFVQPNPDTGLPYTAAEIAALDYDPKLEEQYTEGQLINLAFVTNKQPIKVDFYDVDNNLLDTYTNLASYDGDKFIAPALTATLAEVDLLEPGDKTLFKYVALYKNDETGETTIVSSVFKMLFFEDFDPNADLSKDLVGHWRFNDSNNLLKATRGNDLVLGGLAEHSASGGVNGDDGAALVGEESWYIVDHGILPEGGNPNVNTFSMIWDINIPAASYGSYLNLFQHSPTNGMDGSLLISSNGGGFWLNGGPNDFTGTLVADTWHRVVLTVDEPTVVVYVDGVEIYKGDIASHDGTFSLDPSQFLIFADDSGTAEDEPILVSEFMLFKTALSKATVQNLPPVAEPAIDDIALNIVGRWKFDDPGNLLKAQCGNDLVLGGLAEHSASAGVSGDDGAALVGEESWYVVDHGILPEAGNPNVNTFSMIWDINIPTASYGSYLNLFQHSPTNGMDGSLLISSNGGGFWLNGGPNDFAGTLVADTWHRVVLTVDEPTVVVYVDGVEIYKGDIASHDGTFSLDPSQFLIFADDSGTAEDEPILVSEFILFDIAISKARVENLPSVDTRLF